MSKSTEEGAILLRTIIEGIKEVKGLDILSLDLRKISGAVCDHFVICHGSSTTQVEAIAGKVKKFTSEQLNEVPWKMEGVRNAQWVLLDYVNIVVHVFYSEAREFYNLEDLWGDAKITHYKTEEDPGLRKVSN